MSADTAPSTPTAEPIWTDHGRGQWHNPRRNDVCDREPSRGWRESVPVEYPDAYDGAWGRYHPPGDCVLICCRDQMTRRPVVKTVINLPDRPPWEQEYVRCQVAFGGESE
jgi:hypothetical protein